LEAEAREQILGEADEAIYARRNAAVEQERAIKENELNTEIAVENKKRQIREAQVDAEKAVQQKKREIREAEMAAKIALEERNKELVALSTANAREEADAKASISNTWVRTSPIIRQRIEGTSKPCGRQRAYSLGTGACKSSTAASCRASFLARGILLLL